MTLSPPHPYPVFFLGHSVEVHKKCFWVNLSSFYTWDSQLLFLSWQGSPYITLKNLLKFERISCVMATFLLSSTRGEVNDIHHSLERFVTPQNPVSHETQEKLWIWKLPGIFSLLVRSCVLFGSKIFWNSLFFWLFLQIGKLSNFWKSHDYSIKQTFRLYSEVFLVE